MKENIEKKFVLNRKLVIELRFAPNPQIIDLRGSLISKFQALNLFSFSNWEIGDAALLIKDSPDQNFVRNQLIVDLSKLALICTKIDTIESFYAKFLKAYESLKSLAGDIPISRIGCRIQGTYSTKSSSYESILSNFSKSFQSQVFLSDYPVRDLRFHLVYQNGMYQIGPINENDDFIKREFPFNERINKIGVAIDTDNYLLSVSAGDLNKLSKIKDVLVASLAVEKSLFEKMKDF